MTITGSEILLWSATLVVLGGALGVLTKLFLRPIFLLMGRTNEFLDDWFGTPERDGVPARHGVMHRLKEVEISKADREEMAELFEAITLKADRSEVVELRRLLDKHIAQMDEAATGSGA